MMIIVFCAFFHSTGLNAGTPLATASVPVMAEQPSAKALHSRKMPMFSVATPLNASTCEAWGSVPVMRLEHAHADQQQHRADEDVGGAGEERAALPQAAQVHHHDQQDRQRDQRHGQPGLLDPREGGVDRLNARRHADRNGQDVVRQQRSRGDEARQYAKVGVSHDVAAAAVGIGPDRLPVAEGDDEEEARPRPPRGRGRTGTSAARPRPGSASSPRSRKRRTTSRPKRRRAGPSRSAAAR